ncbi:MAG: hypothetical protein P8M22_03685 [Phycisphaerales bacterium]|nr:hypothetical protein [Phycisphaerales bacterium]
MNQHDPMRRFLGLDSSADPLQVLGLGPTDLNMKSILEARDKREREIEEHPDGQSDQAQLVKAHVQDAAVLLLDSAARMSALARHIPTDVKNVSAAESSSVTEITSFDRQVLGVLTACGGWNSQSRVKLMMIAAQHGVAPSQLMDVLMGMTSWLRSGGAAINRPAESLGSPGAAMQTAMAATRNSQNSHAFDRFVDRWTPDIRANDGASVARLSILFAGITILLLILIVSFLVSTPSGNKEAILDVDSSQATRSLNRPSDGNSIEGIPGEQVVDQDGHFVTRVEIPSSLVDASDAVVSTTVGLDLLAEAIGRGEEASSTISTFAELIDVAAQGWFLAGDSQRTDLVESTGRVFEMIAGDIAQAKSLLANLKLPPVSSQDVEAIPVATFHSGILGAITENRRISPSIREEARRILAEHGIAGLRGDGFSSAAIAWLNQVRQSLLEGTKVGSDKELQWEIWTMCLLALGDVPGSQASILVAVEGIVRDGLEIGSPSPARRTLMRTLNSVDYIGSPLARTAFLGLYVDESLDSRRLGILTDLLASNVSSSWFDQSMIVDSSADMARREYLANVLASKWPGTRQIAVRRPMPVPRGFDDQLAAFWLEKWGLVEILPPGRSDVAMLEHLLDLRVLNQSASAIVDGDAAAASRIFNRMENDMILQGDNPLVDQEFNSMRAWGQRMSKAGDREEKLALLNELMNHGPGDLGPSDAAVLANVALAGATRIRERAHQVIEQRFLSDPELVLAVLNELPRRPSEDVSAFLDEMVGQSLPDVQAAQWGLEIRRLLAERAMELRARDNKRIDYLASLYRDSVLEEVRSLMQVEAEPDVSAARALALLAESRTDRIRGVMAASDMAILSRMIQEHEVRFRLAEGPLQQSLVRSLAVLDLVTMEWSIRMPSQMESFDWIQEDLRFQLPVASHVLEQLVLIEMAIGKTWQVVIEDYRKRIRMNKGPIG